MAALAERRIIPHEELMARSEEKAEAQAKAQSSTQSKAHAENARAEGARVETIGAENVRADNDHSENVPADNDRAETAGAENENGSAEDAQSENVPEIAEQSPAETTAPEARPEHMRLLEALLFAASSPLDEKTLASRLPEDVDVKASMRALQLEYAPRGVNLVRVNNKWAFRTAPDLSWLLTKEATVPKKLSRAAIETLAVIAYHQPVTRAEVEEIRGVALSKGTIDVLLETGWIKPRGRRKVPGRPITYGTSEEFLSHFGLEALNDLPGLEELKGSGLLDSRLPPGFAVPMPSDDPALRDDEDPLEPGDLDLGLAPPPERAEE